MRITSSSIPIHIARAYGVEQAINVSRAFDRADATASEKSPNDSASTRQLIAGLVPGSVDFSADQPTASAPALAMYRHPADRNAAATNVDAGRVIDTTA